MVCNLYEISTFYLDIWKRLRVNLSFAYHCISICINDMHTKFQLSNLKKKKVLKWGSRNQIRGPSRRPHSKKNVLRTFPRLYEIFWCNTGYPEIKGIEGVSGQWKRYTRTDRYTDRQTHSQSLFSVYCMLYMKLRSK